MSRHQARKAAHRRDIRGELAARGISLQAAGKRTVDEEISDAYKDVAEVVDVAQRWAGGDRGAAAADRGGEGLTRSARQLDRISATASTEGVAC
jgi:hypothetical protein